MDNITHKTREEWLEAAMVLMHHDVFTTAQINPSEWETKKIKISCSFPMAYRGSRSGKAVTLGQAFDPIVSEGGFTEIVINPLLDNPMDVLATTAHEMIHGFVGIECGHRGDFARVARAIGYIGPLTVVDLTKLTNSITPALESKFKEIADILGSYPHSKVDPQLRKKQTTRNLKLECSHCGFTARASATQLAKIGPSAPCPVCEKRGTLITQ